MSQWLDRVKFGNGHDGSPAVSGTINTYAACTGTATQLSLTTALAASAGDCILIHQSQGTGAGQWELNYVLADAGATLTLAYPLAYTYATGAQAVLVPQYTGGTLSGAVTGTAWGGSVGGIVALMSSGDLTVSGSITAPTGFRGGVGSKTSSETGNQGEGYTGTGTTNGAANTSGGGGGYTPITGSPGMGGGGGHTTDGGRSAYNANGSVSGYGGTSCGTAALTTIFFGGGGGGPVQSDTIFSGKNGAGIVFIFAKNFILSGTIPCNGVSATADFGGCGAGGSCLIKCQTATLGTNKITASGGTNFQGYSNQGSVGRIHIDYADSYTGTTTPTIDATQVTTLKSQVYGSMI